MSNGRCVLDDYERGRVAFAAREQALADRGEGISYNSYAQVVAAAREAYDERMDEWARVWAAAYDDAVIVANEAAAEENEHE